MIIVILGVNSLALIAWGRYLNSKDAYVSDKGNEYRLFWLIMSGGLPSIIITLTMQSKWEHGLFALTGLYNGMNPFVENLLVVGPVEELSKFIVFIVLTGIMKSIKEPRDGILQAASVAMGFALVENILYAFKYGYSVLILRSFLTILGHMSYAVIWGFVWGAAVYTSGGSTKTPDKFVVIPSLILAAAFHGTYNTLLDYGYLVGAIFIDIISMSLFFIIYTYVEDNSPYRSFKLREYKKAIPELRRGLQKHPESFILNKRMGVFNIYAEHYRRAGKYLNKARKIKPANASARFYYGVSKYLNGETEKGLMHINSAVGALPEDMQKKMIGTINNVVKSKSARSELLGRVNNSDNFERKHKASRYNRKYRTSGNKLAAQRRIVRLIAERERESKKK